MLSVETHGNVLVVKLIGAMDENDLRESIQLVDRKVEEMDDLRLLLDLRRQAPPADFQTAWLELKLVTTHSDQVGKVAVVGSLDWQKLATALVRPFTRAEERIFEADEVDEALEWLRT